MTGFGPRTQRLDSPRAFLADADENATVDLADVPAFVSCALGNTLMDDCHCADMDGSGAVSGSDVQAFADALLGDAGACE